MTKELDMGFTVEEVAKGIERILERQGVVGSSSREGETIHVAASEGLTVTIAPMPEERIRHPAFFPRTLLVLRGNPEPVAAFYEKVVHYFLRVTG